MRWRDLSSIARESDMVVMVQQWSVAVVVTD